jgi:UDP-N-acetylmuramoyl-tripeptide--D-alanyl-D-alanine ligase
MKINKQIIESIQYGYLQNCPKVFSSAAVIDSRKLTEGMIFFALKGENTDGHNFVQSALNKKPTLCVVEKNWFEANARELQKSPLWIVENSEKALQLLAKKVREIAKIPVFALTGTNGKTSTRSMISAVLDQKFHVLSTIGNLNNHLGLPLSLLQLTEKHEIAVLEMGTNHFGEIKFLCEIAKPDFGLITNIGRGHTEFLQSRAGVARAKEELFSAIPEEGTIFLNADDEFIPQMNYRAKQAYRFGFEAEKLDFKARITDVDNFGRATFSVNNAIEIKLSVPGVYQAANALAALVAGRHFEIDYEKIKIALENYQGVSNRFGIRQSRYKIIDDTYNANPESTLAAIRTLAKIQTGGKKYFILGDMMELGEKKEEFHREMGKAIAASDIDYFFTHGILTAFANEAAQRAGHPQSRHFSSKGEIIKLLKEKLTEADVVLLKGSRSTKMEEIIEGINQ